jgi:hypothetical protein
LKCIRIWAHSSGAVNLGWNGLIIARRINSIMFI